MASAENVKTAVLARAEKWEVGQRVTVPPVHFGYAWSSTIPSHITKIYGTITQLFTNRMSVLWDVDANETMISTNRATMHGIGMALALHWHWHCIGIALHWRCIGIGIALALALHWHCIGIALALHWHCIGIGIALALHWHGIGIGGLPATYPVIFCHFPPLSIGRKTTEKDGDVVGG